MVKNHAARASSDLSLQARTSFLENDLRLMDSLASQFDASAEEQSKRFVAAHERFSARIDKQRFQVVYPVLPIVVRKHSIRASRRHLLQPVLVV
jgi:hypothetical protein